MPAILKEKQVTVSYGYWRIMAIYGNRWTRQCKIDVGLWPGVTEHDNGVMPVETREYHFNGDAYPLPTTEITQDNIVTAAYNALLAHEDFAGGVLEP